MIPRFRSGLFFRDDGGLPYVLSASLVYDSAILDRRVTVPKGFKTDLASIPRALWALLPKSGAYDKAAVVHDFLYVRGDCTRSEADDVLREAMETLKVGGWTRHVIYAGVRIGGGVPWGRYRRGELEAC